MYDLVNYLRIYDTITGVTTPVVRVSIPAGNKASKASQCETLREEKKASSNCWKDKASGG